ncbi:MAG: hypothetical protein JNK11_15455, partial [Alphaproteobacteria bacterium]|nr:hypothetical protein [Alphaproteobacteria bacterium]
NLGVEVTMPVVYPSGQLVNVVVSAERGAYVVHDASAGAMQLTASGIDLTRAMAERLERLAQDYGCDYVAGRISTLATVEQMAVAVALVANASRAVGDLARAEERARASRFADAVAAAVTTAAGQRSRLHERVTGESGKHYAVTAVLLDAAQSRPVAFVEAVARPKVVPQHVAKLLDLSGEHPQVHREAVYDETAEWDSPNLVLLRRVSNPVPRGMLEKRTRALLRAA